MYSPPTPSDWKVSRVRTLLGGIGEEVTKDNAAVNAFYRKLVAAGQKY